MPEATNKSTNDKRKLSPVKNSKAPSREKVEKKEPKSSATSTSSLSFGMNTKILTPSASSGLSFETDSKTKSFTSKDKKFNPSTASTTGFSFVAPAPSINSSGILPP